MLKSQLVWECVSMSNGSPVRADLHQRALQGVGRRGHDAGEDGPGPDSRRGRGRHWKRLVPGRERHPSITRRRHGLTVRVPARNALRKKLRRRRSLLRQLPGTGPFCHGKFRRPRRSPKSSRRPATAAPQRTSEIPIAVMRSAEWLSSVSRLVKKLHCLHDVASRVFGRFRDQNVPVSAISKWT